MIKILQLIKPSKFALDVGTLLGNKFFNIGLGILSSVLIARLLGPSGKGIITTAMVLPGLVTTFADLGLRQAITYFMGKKIYSDQQIISTVSLLILFTSLLGVAGALAGFLATGFQVRYGWSVVLMALCTIPPNLALQYASGVFLAKREISRTVLLSIIPSVFGTICVLVLFILKISKIEYFMIIEVGSALFTAAYILSLLRKYGSLKPVLIPEMIWMMLKKGVVYALAIFVITLNYRVDIVILERLTNSAEVGIYSIGATVANMLWLIPNTINVVNFSHSASAKSIVEHSRKTVLLLRIVLWSALVPFIFLFILSPYLIPLIYGNDFAASGLVVQAILPGVWAMLIFKILNSDLAGQGRPGTAFWVYVVAAAINIICNIWWDPQYGALGAAWASTVSYMFGGLLFAIVYSRISNINPIDLFMIRKSDLAALIDQIKMKNRA